MGKSVLMSIKPNWCDKIASGEKTIEIRKTKPKLETPFKVYIYCTKPSFPHEDFIVSDADEKKIRAFYGGGNVIGGFVCERINNFHVPFPAYWDEVDKDTLYAACISYGEAHDYLHHRGGYAWVISDLKIYDEPKLLSDFYRWYEDGEDIRPCQNGKKCQHEYFDYGENTMACGIDYDGTDCPYFKVQRPPQSWMYVEGLE